MRPLIPAAARAYTVPHATWWPMGLLLLAVIPAIGGWSIPCALLLTTSCIASAATRRQLNPLRELMMMGGYFDVTLQSLRLAVLLLLGAHIWTNVAIAVAFTCAGIALVLMAIFANITVDRLAVRLEPEIFTRNLAIAPTHPPRLARLLASGLALVVAELILIAGAAFVTSSVLVAWTTAILAIVALAVGTLATDRILRTQGNAFRNKILGEVQRAIQKLHPEVALYHGMSQGDAVYQVDGWLSPMEQVPRPTIVIVRSVATLESMGATTLPVLAITRAQDLLHLDLTTLRACLFVANTGDVIHLIREQNPMSAFIGHGDSDKNSSFNPFTKVYDEVWVAGEAGEQRYSRAKIGMRTEQFVYVGRPQLDAIDMSVLPSGESDRTPTVLYAPTWEGWNSEQEYCSLLTQGVKVIEQLLAHERPIRLIYKPHPFTGLRTAAARTASNRIIGMIQAANARNGFTNTPPAPSTAAETKSAKEANELATSVGNEFFARLDQHEHVVIHPDAGLGLFQCFEHADSLITDISSVLSDFIATGRPYAVCNPRNVSEAAFIDEFPSTRGGVVIDRSGENARDFLDVVTGSAPDALRVQRDEVREFLLGSTTPTATERFNAAIADLVDRAEARIADRAIRESGVSRSDRQ